MRLVFVSVLLLGGCASIDVVHMPDGKRAYVAECYEGKSECLNLAAEQCGGRYHVLDHESQTDLYANATPGMIAYAGTQETDRVIFRCGPAPKAP